MKRYGDFITAEEGLALLTAIRISHSGPELLSDNRASFKMLNHMIFSISSFETL